MTESLPAEVVAPLSAAQATADEVDLQAGITDLASLVADSLGLDVLLDRVAAAATRAIPGADGAGVTLLRIDSGLEHGGGVGVQPPVRQRDRWNSVRDRKWRALYHRGPATAHGAFGLAGWGKDVAPLRPTGGPTRRLPGSHYVDLGNDVVATSALLGLHERAVTAGRVLVTGAGFGVLATESVVLRLCEGHPVPVHVRTDAIPSVELQAGVLGEALAATIVDGLPEGGRRYTNGALVRARVGGDRVQLRLPDGSTVTTASAPLGELLAAHRASGAPDVVAASSEVPTSPAVRAALPLASVLLSITPLRTVAKRRLARVKFGNRERPRQHSWGHASLQWPDGVTSAGWLRAADASVFTAAVLAEVARRLFVGEGSPGAHTPGALFGPSLAQACGGEFVLTAPAGHTRKS